MVEKAKFCIRYLTQPKKKKGLPKPPDVTHTGPSRSFRKELQRKLTHHCPDFPSLQGDLHSGREFGKV